MTCSNNQLAAALDEIQLQQQENNNRRVEQQLQLGGDWRQRKQTEKYHR